MSIVRMFLIAPSLARLIRKERGATRVTEGYFNPRAGRLSFARIEGPDCHLILVTTDAEGHAKEERTLVPRAHVDALLDVCAGTATYERTTIPLDGRDVLIDHVLTPGDLDIVSVVFDDAAAAEAFVPPIWFGSDVSTKAGYERHSVAIDGVPATEPAAVNNATLNAVLDLVESRFGVRSVGTLRTAA